MNISTKKINVLLIAVALFILAAGMHSINVHAVTTVVLQKAAPNTHSFTKLPLTNDGWTDFRHMIKEKDGYQNARVVFVSGSGDDNTGTPSDISALTFDKDGFSLADDSVKPYRSITAGSAQIRSGHPDILLFKRGDVWDGSIGTWTKSGPSPDARIIIGSYGTGERPVFNIGGSTAISPGNAQNLIVTGLEFRSLVGELDTSLRGDSIRINGAAATDQLYEDCYLNWTNQIQVQGSMTSGYHERIAFRRNMLDETRTVFATQTQGLLFEENVFSKPKARGRHLYLSPSGNLEQDTLRGVEVKRNIFFDSAAGGLHLRGGGELVDNLIVRNDHVLVGGAGGGLDTIFGSADSIQSGTISHNVFLEGPQGTAGDGLYSIHLRNNDGSTVTNNIWTDPTGISAGSIALYLAGHTEVNIARNIYISGNIIYDWKAAAYQSRGVVTSGAFTDVQNVTITGNDFQMVNGASDLILLRARTNGEDRFDGFTFRDNRYYSSDGESTWFSPSGTLEGWVQESGETGAQSVKLDVDDTEGRYPYPSRNLKTYNSLLGGNPSTEEFMSSALNQARGNWQPAYTACVVNNYIREGFNKEPIECLSF